MSSTSKKSGNASNGTLTVASITAFKEQFARILLAVQVEKHSYLSLENIFADNGLPVPTRKNVADDYKIEIEDQEPYVGMGTEFKDLTPAAQQRKLADEMKALRQRAYRYLKSLFDAKLFDRETAEQHLRALQLPVPAVESIISGFVYDEDGNEISFSNVHLAGAHTKEEIHDRLAAAYPNGSRSRQLVTSVFPEAKNPADVVHSLVVAERLNWPNASDITAEPVTE